MRKLFYLFILILLSLTSQAQNIKNYYTIYVVDANQLPVANDPILFVYNGGQSIDTIYTDHTGKANSSINNSFAGSWTRIFTMSGGWVCVDSTEFITGLTTGYFSDTLVSCATGSICNFSIKANLNGGGPSNWGSRNFSTTYTGNPNSTYLWEFGDGNTSNSLSPNHVYSAAGTYTYCLTVDSCPKICDTIIVAEYKSFTISGYVLDSNGQAHANKQVWTKTTHPYTGSSLEQSWTPLWITDNNGYFSFTGNFETYPTQSTLKVMVKDSCGTFTNTSFFGNKIFTIDTSTPVNTVFYDTVITCSQQPCSYIVNHVTSPSGSYSFTHSNVNPNSTYLWTFGDGDSSTLSNPTHTYFQPGTYTYCLKVDNCPPVCGTVVVPISYTPILIDILMLDQNAMPIPNQSLIIYNYQSGSNTTFYNYITDNNGRINDTIWVNGTGLLEGDKGTGGCLDTVKFIYTPNTPAYTMFTDTLNLCSAGNCNASFTATDTGLTAYINPVSIGSPGEFIFYWGDNTSDTVSSLNIPTVPYSHTYAQPGQYTICVSHHSIACSDSYCDTVVISGGNFTPIIVNLLMLDQNAMSIPFQPIVIRNYMSSGFIDYSYSTDINGQVFDTIWVNGSGLLESLNYLGGCADTSSFFYTANTPSYTLFIDTIDLCLTSSCNASFTVIDTGLTAYIYPISIGSPGQFIFYWGDNTSDTVSSMSIPSVPYNHSYAQPGQYAICVEHFDSMCNDIVCDSINLSVVGPACNAEFIIDTVNSIPGNGIVIWNTSTPLNAPGVNMQYQWNFGDGNNSTLPFPSHIYSSAGTYSVCLTIIYTDVNGLCSSTFCDTLVIDSLGNLVYKGQPFQLRVLDPNSISIEEKQLSNVKMYPNPTNELLNIEFVTIHEKVEIQLYNLSGQVLKDQSQTTEYGNNRIKINLSDLPSGIYIMEMKAGDNYVRERVIKH